MKLLIVEDHAAMRKTLRSVLNNGSLVRHEIYECDNGEEAVRLFAIHHPDYILMDIQLRVMDGFATSELILANDPAARIIFVSSHNAPSFRERAKNLNAYGFIAKDNLNELLHLLN
ncbi:MAG: response regulator transcription factor [Bacteroidetes bacterium]|nr:response regulator transcription factor [Bacteroidota bacterium]